MQFFLDTANLSDIRWAAQAGLIDGVTTNPTLLARWRASSIRGMS
jgi:transaldolase